MRMAIFSVARKAEGRMVLAGFLFEGLCRPECAKFPPAAYPQCSPIQGVGFTVL